MANDVVNGSDVLIFISPSTGTTDWESVAHATSHTLSIKMATRDTSNKGSGVYVTKAAGRLEVAGTLEGMYIDNDKYNLEDLMSVITQRQEVLMVFGKPTDADATEPDTTTGGGAHFYASGKFILTSVDATFPDQANSTYSATFEHVDGFAINSLYTT